MSGLSYRSSDRGVLQPEDGNRIIVEVELSKLDPEEATRNAEHIFGLTKNVVESNNQAIKIWNSQMEMEIDKKLNDKRQELIRLFGKK